MGYSAVLFSADSVCNECCLLPLISCNGYAWLMQPIRELTWDTLVCLVCLTATTILAFRIADRRCPAILVVSFLQATITSFNFEIRRVENASENYQFGRDMDHRRYVSRGWTVRIDPPVLRCVTRGRRWCTGKVWSKVVAFPSRWYGTVYPISMWKSLRDVTHHVNGILINSCWIEWTSFLQIGIEQWRWWVQLG